MNMFPEAELTSLRHHLNIFDQAGLHIAHQSTRDYRPTLRARFHRLVERQAAAMAIVEVEVHNRFLCSLADARRLFDHQDLVPTRSILQRQDTPVKLRTEINFREAILVSSSKGEVTTWRS